MKDFLKSKFFIGLLCFSMFCLGTILYSVVSSDINLIDDIPGMVVTSVQNAATKISGFFGGFIESLTNYKNVKSENEKLKETINNLEKEIEENKTLIEENRELKEVLGLYDSENEFVFEAATVIAKEPGSWFNVFTINKGTIHGVNVGNTVITSDGLVGTVKDVGPTWAKVVGIIDTQSVVGAILPKTNDAGIIEGDYELSKEGLCKLIYIDNSVKVTRGDLVYTSGLGGAYPEGIRIGKVEEVYTEKHGVSQYAVIRPSVDFNKVRTVLVIKSFKIKVS